MKRSISFLAAALALTLLLSACGDSPAADGDSVPATPQATDASPQAVPGDDGDNSQAQGGILSSFSTTDLDGAAADETIFADHSLTMINVWATYCSPCLQEMPDLGTLAADYADKGLQVVGLVTDVLNTDGSLSEDQLATARDIVEATGADYLHLVPSQDLYGLLGQITAVPTTFFVDSSGAQVGAAYLGARSLEAWADIVDAALLEAAP